MPPGGGNSESRTLLMRLSRSTMAGYVEPVHEFGEPEKAFSYARSRRPVIRLLDWKTSQPDALTVMGKAGERFVLDGLLWAEACR
jgi:hypothetical protein